MKKDFAISLIIPAHNEEKYIGATLDHAIESGAGRFKEIVVIDNLSTDGTKNIAEQRKGVRVVQENKKGLVMARQRGYIETKGDILAYVDADTHMPKDWYDKVVAEFSKDDNLVCLSGPYIYHDIPRWQQHLVKVYWYLLGMPAYFLIGYMVTGANFAIRRSSLEKMNGFDTRIAFYGEDTNIARRASAYGKVKFKPSFVMYTSGRRLAGQGLFKTGWIYVANFLSEVVLKRPVHSEYKDIR